MRRTFFTLLLAFVSSFTFLFAQPGNALNFDGVNDNVTAALPSVFSNIAANDFTMEAWVYPTGAIFSRIIYAQSSTTNFATMSTGASNQIYFYVIVGGTTYSVATTANLPTNTWTHVAARWTAATLTPVVFFNGVQQATAAGGGSSTGSLSNLSIGTRPGGAQYFPGSLDEVRIWSTARTQCEIQANMNRTFPGPQPGLVVNYTFDQGVAGGTNTGVTTLTDLSASVNTGTLNGFALSGATSNWVSSAANITASGAASTGIQVTTNAAICSGGSYTFPDGSIQTNITSPVTQTSTLTTSLGCDSVITTHVAVSPSYAIQDTAQVCAGGSYTFPDGSTQSNITSPVSQVSTLQAQTGCDSTITTLVQVLAATNDTVTARVCDGSSYIYPDGSIDTNITTNVTQTSILQNALGCDSVIVTQVEVGFLYSMMAFDSTCDGSTYTFLDGTTAVVNGQATHVNQYVSIYGCDSIIVQIVDGYVIDTAVQLLGAVLHAPLGATSYQWLDCATGAPIIGAVNQTFEPPFNGSFAVVLTNQLGCTDTSNCRTVIVLATAGPAQPALLAYPNPSTGAFTLELPADISVPVRIEVLNALGQTILTDELRQSRQQLDLAGLPAGVYTLRAHVPAGMQALRLVVAR
jgi:hypothetical protein